MGLATHVSTWSKDPTAQVGAVVVAPNKCDMFMGYNGFPQGIEDSLDRLSTVEVKNSLTVHAELNTILNSTKDLTGWTMYSTRSPCTKCALAIIRKSIAEVITLPILQSSKWYLDQIQGKTLLHEAKINYRLIGDLQHETSSY